MTSEPTTRPLFCERCRAVRAVRVDARRALGPGEESVAYTCPACGTADRFTVRHALAQGVASLTGGAPVCEGGAGPVALPERRISCHLCERRLAAPVPLTLPDACLTCPGCRTAGPHARWAELDARGAEWVARACRGCGEVSRRPGLNHVVFGAGTACGLPGVPGRKVLRELANVDCPACLAATLARAPARHPAERAGAMRCETCEASTEHALEGLTLGADQWLVATCSACGGSRATGRLKHWSRPGGGFYCGAGTGVRAKQLHRLSCQLCIRALVEEKVGLPVPDWRPEQAIAEDHYAA